MANDNTTKLNRQQQALLYVMGQMAELEERGLVCGGYKITDDGRMEYQRLVDTGFTPTEDEIRTASATVYYEATKLGQVIVSKLPN